MPSAPLLALALLLATPLAAADGIDVHLARDSVSGGCAFDETEWRTRCASREEAAAASVQLLGARIAGASIGRSSANDSGSYGWGSTTWSEHNESSERDVRIDALGEETRLSYARCRGYGSSYSWQDGESSESFAGGSSTCSYGPEEAPLARCEGSSWSYASSWGSGSEDARTCDAGIDVAQGDVSGGVHVLLADRASCWDGVCTEEQARGVQLRAGAGDLDAGHDLWLPMEVLP